MTHTTLDSIESGTFEDDGYLDVSQDFWAGDIDADDIRTWEPEDVADEGDHLADLVRDGFYPELVN